MTLIEAIKDIYFNPVMTSFIYLFVISLSNGIKANCSIENDFNKRNRNVLNKTPEINKLYDSIDYLKFSESEYQILIKDFCNFMLEKYPQEFLVNMYNNINDMKILNNKFLFLNSSVGRYLPIDNIIEISKTSALFHELFHLASCYVDKDDNEMIYGGFRQIDFKNNIDIGSSINEGYTELLAHRYFGKKYKMSISYRNEINVVKKLESIVGNNKMELLYLKADLNELVDNLTKYTSRNEVLDFITKLDIISNNYSNMFLTKNDKIEDCFITVCEFLLKIYTNKLAKDLENGFINEEVFVDKSLAYLKSFKNVVTIGKYSYYPMEDVPMLNNWKKILKKNKLSH